METYPGLIRDLTGRLSKLPGVGPKSAQRIAFYIMLMERDDVDLLINSIDRLKNKLKICKICGNLTENIVCSICDSPDRDKSKICVVEDAGQIYQFEKTDSYNGLYHVLGGIISPLNNIGPDDLNIDMLLNRIKSETVKEIILAISSGMDAETTILYLKKKLQLFDLNVTRIAFGIPYGSSIEFTDTATLSQSLKGRKEIL